MLGKMKWKAPRREHAVEELSTYRARARHHKVKNEKKPRILNKLITDLSPVILQLLD